MVECIRTVHLHSAAVLPKMVLCSTCGQMHPQSLLVWPVWGGTGRNSRILGGLCNAERPIPVPLMDSSSLLLAELHARNRVRDRAGAGRPSGHGGRGHGCARSVRQVRDGSDPARSAVP